MAEGLEQKMSDDLTENDVHVWYCHCDDPEVVSHRDDYLSLLSAEEVARYQRFAFDKDRSLFLIARALLRTTLSRYAETAPGAWKFEQTAKGKLFLPGESAAPPLRFNISHSQQVAVCAVTRRRTVGVDVEWTRRQTDQKIVTYFLSEPELSHYHDAEGEARRELFFRYWTLKEAYAKAVGVGLALRFAEFSFHLEEHAPPAIVLASPAEASAWQFHQQPLPPDYWLAVAAECPSSSPLAFTVRCSAPTL